MVYLSDIIQELLEIGAKQTELLFRINNFDSTPMRDLDMVSYTLPLHVTSADRLAKFDDFQDDDAPIDGLDERTNRSRILRNMHAISRRYKQRAISDTRMSSCYEVVLHH